MLFKNEPFEANNANSDESEFTEYKFNPGNANAPERKDRGGTWSPAVHCPRDRYESRHLAGEELHQGGKREWNGR